MILELTHKACTLEKSWHGYKQGVQQCNPSALQQTMSQDLVTEESCGIDCL